MMHKVVKPFPFSEDGFTLIDLVAGDERDFGTHAAGLLTEGWVEEINGAAPVEPAATVAAGEPAKPAKRTK